MMPSESELRDTSATVHFILSSSTAVGEKSQRDQLSNKKENNKLLVKWRLLAEFLALPTS